MIQTHGEWCTEFGLGRLCVSAKPDGGFRWVLLVRDRLGDTERRVSTGIAVHFEDARDAGFQAVRDEARLRPPMAGYEGRW